MKANVSLGTYPYTYARVSVLRSELLVKEDYHRLIKMSLSEIIEFLQSTQYKESINKLAVTYKGVELMETALNEQLVETWDKLKRISPDEVDFLINAYLQRFDLLNIKTILRSIYANETAEQLLLPAGLLSQEKLKELLSSESVEEFAKKLRIVGIRESVLAEALNMFTQNKSISEFENILEQIYYGRMYRFAQLIPSKGKLFKQFLEAEIEMTNIMNILRLKRAGMEQQQIPHFVIGRITPLISKLLAAEPQESANLLAGYASEGALKAYTEHHSLAELELELGRNLLKKTKHLLRQKPMSADVILGYMFAKEIEVKNLKTLLKARQLNLSDEFVEQQLII